MAIRVLSRTLALNQNIFKKCGPFSIKRKLPYSNPCGDPPSPGDNLPIPKGWLGNPNKISTLLVLYFVPPFWAPFLLMPYYMFYY